MAFSYAPPNFAPTDLLSRLRANLLRGCTPSVIASPPTVTVNTSSQIASARVYNYAHAALTCLAASWYLDHTNLRTLPVTGDNQGTGSAYTGGLARTASSGSVYFWTDAAILEVDCTYAKLRLYVRNETTGRWEVAVSSLTGGDGSTRTCINLAFGSTAPAGRLVRVDGDASFKLYAIRVGPLASVWAYQQAAPVKAIAFGDSYVGGTGASTQFDGCFQQLWLMLGIDDGRCSSAGGTSAVKANPATPSVAYKDRYICDVINQGPFDLVIIEGSGNAYDQVLTDETAALAAIYDAVHAAFPNAMVIATNSWNTGSDSTGTPQRSRAAVSTAIEAAWAGRPWLKTINMRNWIFGTGYSGATTGDGNADLYVASDVLHPNGNGAHLFRAQQLNAAVRGLIRTLV